MKKMFEELKAFLFRGNVLDLAVAVIIGAAFNQIITSLVEDIISPIIGLLFNQTKFADITLGTIRIGSFFDQVVNFLIVGVTLFFILKVATKMTSLRKSDETEEVVAPAGPTQEELLAEIRDLLKSK